jgi:hypothetical protein
MIQLPQCVDVGSSLRSVSLETGVPQYKMLRDSTIPQYPRLIGQSNNNAKMFVRGAQRDRTTLLSKEEKALDNAKVAN